MKVAFDVTFCVSKVCPKRAQCGTHIGRLSVPKDEGYCSWQSDFFEAAVNGECKHQTPYQEWKIEPETKKENNNELQ